MTLKNTNRVLEAAIRGERAVALDVQKMDVDGRRANVLMRVGPNVVKDEDSFDKAIATVFGGKVRLMRGSAHHPAEDKSLVLACVELNSETRPFDDSGVKGLTAVTPNVFRDEGDNIWRKAGEGEMAVLIKDTADEIEAVLASRQSVSIATASTKVDLHEHAAIGHGIGWFDPSLEKMRFGVKCGPTVAFDVSTMSVHEISDRDVFVVSSHDYQREVAARYEEMFGKGNAPLSKENGPARYLKYMGLLFNQRETYYNRLRALMEQSFGAAAIRG